MTVRKLTDKERYLLRSAHTSATRKYNTANVERRGGRKRPPVTRLKLKCLTCEGEA
jgi:hypothetical protein